MNTAFLRVLLGEVGLLASALSHAACGPATSQWASSQIPINCWRRPKTEPRGVRTKTWTGYAARPRLLRCSEGLRKPSELLIRTSLYQRMYVSNAATKFSMVVESQSRSKNISVFSRPKKPSQAALSGEHPLRDIERISFASAILASQPGQR